MTTPTSATEQRIAEIREQLWAYDSGRLNGYGFMTAAPEDVRFLLAQLASVPAQIEAAVQAEREACAEIADRRIRNCDPSSLTWEAGDDIGSAIRARGVAK